MIDMVNLRDKMLLFPTTTNLTVSTLISTISEAFDVSNKIRLFNFFGYEIAEDSDCSMLMENVEKIKVLYFTKSHDFFENKNIMRIFKIKDKIGEGGFGKVYLAELKASHEFFAIKIFRHSLTSVQDLNFLYKEIEALRKLNHPNIIKLLTYCVLENDKIALILEFAAGGTLREYLTEKGRLEESEARGLFLQILTTVSYCHKKNIIHRDLKLENILFGDEERKIIKLIDFSVSGIFEVDKCSSGTLKYMAPEVLSGLDTQSLPQLDIWSLGCILYELLTGEVLFKGTKEEIKDNVIRSKYSMSTDISKEASHLIQSMLKRNSVDRITMNACFDHPWINDSILPEYMQSEMTEINKLELKAIDVRMTHNSMTQTDLNRLHSRMRSKTNTVKEKRPPNLPGLMTKIDTEFKESSFYDYNFSIIRKYNGKIPNFLQPIGHTKQQKQKIIKIRNFIASGYEIEQREEKKQNCNNNSEIKEEKPLRKHKTSKLLGTVRESSIKIRNILASNHLKKTPKSESKGLGPILPAIGSNSANKKTSIDICNTPTISKFNFSNEKKVRPKMSPILHK